MSFDAVGGCQSNCPATTSDPMFIADKFTKSDSFYSTPVDSFLIESYTVVCLKSQASYNSSLPDAVATPSFSFSSTETFSVDFQSSALSLSDRMGCEKW